LFLTRQAIDLLDAQASDPYCHGLDISTRRFELLSLRARYQILLKRWDIEHPPLAAPLTGGFVFLR
jgi:hypothetical protein